MVRSSNSKILKWNISCSHPEILEPRAIVGWVIYRYTAVCSLTEDGTINLQEFIAIMTKWSTQSVDEQIREAFQMFDKDGSGTITADVSISIC